MQLNNYKKIYFLGIGGIGMSALARYFNALDKKVEGYDLTETTLTNQLESEGISVHYKEKTSNILDKEAINSSTTLIIYTPAIPATNQELVYFKSNNYDILKRAQVLGLISKEQQSIAIAGTHGKTTVTSIVAHILMQNNTLLSGFLGGISKNYNSNLLLNKSLSDNTEKNKNFVFDDKYIVLEADEYDKSFLNFEPQITLITSVDKDHLDIYKNEQNLIKTFEKFASQNNKNGIIILNNKVNLKINKEVKKYTYSLESDTDFYAKNIRIKNSFYTVDIVTPDYIINDVKLSMPGLINVENTIAATALAYSSGVPKDIIKKALINYLGVKRRFDIQIQSEKITYIDDYAHHPEEIEAFLNSVRKMYPTKKITGIFQPHLYSRTQDFAEEFAESLALLDTLILTEIYPAREKPIRGVTSKMLFDLVNLKDKILCEKQNLIEVIKNKDIEVLLTIGAGDIDKEVKPIKELLNKS